MNLILSITALVISVVALARTFRRRRLTLKQIAALACDHGEHAESKTMPRWKLAYEAGIKIDLDDNGRRDFTDAKLRFAIDAEAKARGWPAKS